VTALLQRQCSRCHVERSIEEFARDATKATGYKSICKPCDNAKSKRYYETHREEKLAAQSSRRGIRICKCGGPATSPRHRYCDRCRALRDEVRRRRKRSGKHSLTNQRDYGAAHQKLRKQWRPIVEAGGVACATCRRPIIPGSPWDLGHDERDRSRYIGPQHASCNRAVAKPLYPPRTQTERGYGWEHQKLRKQWTRLVEQGGVNCARCHKPIPPGSRWELGHDDFDRSLYNGPEHFECNRNAPRRKPARV
jgi:hypothetical protein